MLKVLAWVLLCMILNSHAQRISFKGEVPPYLKDKVQEVQNLLPDNYFKGLVEIEVRGKDFKRRDLCNLDDSIQLGTLTHKRGVHKMAINPRLIVLAKEVKEEFPCLHGTFEKMLVATIIHELTHVKDNYEKISLNPDFQRIVGVKKLTKLTKKKLLNQNAAVSPDTYEFKNLEEALAVNAEYLLLDSDFECRKPATANFLSWRLGIRKKGVCRKNYKIITQSAYLEDNYLSTASLSPARIYQVHYLYAGKGEPLMSRWGHAMLRLVICAPHRKEVGPECMGDTSHHLVLSYRAYIAEMKLNYIKGLSGDYPSQLFIMRFHEIQQEYNKFELRDLYSIPLSMSVKQIHELIDLTIERYWTYQGKYYFLGNNCGTETQKHLAVALSDEQSGDIHATSPSRMYRDITKASNDLTVEKIQGLSRAELIAKGILIESMSKELEKSFQLLKSFGLFEEKNFKRFLRKTTAEKRFEAYERYFSLKAPSSQVLMRLIYLERYLLNRFVMALPKRAAERMKKDATLKSLVLDMGDNLKAMGLQPWKVVSAGYGVPTQREFESQYADFVTRRQTKMRSVAEQQLHFLQKILDKKHFDTERLEKEHYRRIKELSNDLLIKINQFQENL